MINYAMFYLFWFLVSLPVAWFIFDVIRVRLNKVIPDKKLHDALDVISRPAVVTSEDFKGFVVPVIYTREVVFCYYCGEKVVQPTRWLPLPGEPGKKFARSAIEETNNFMQILLHHGTGLLNSLIRWQTRSHYAHASVLMHDNTNIIVQSLPGKGVHVAQIKNWEGIDRFSISESFNETAVYEFLTSKVGKKYDYSGVLRFLTREKSADDQRWFCSELVFAAFAATGLLLLNCREAYKISPALLALSPYLRKV